MLDLSEQKWPEAEISALKGQMYKENLPLRDEVERASMFEEIVGTSKPLKAVLSQIAKVAPTYSTVLITRINKETLELLQSYGWPGNIRELQNVIERSVILCETEIFLIDESWLPEQRLRQNRRQGPVLIEPLT